jgi:hypothetical protein
MTRLLYVCLVAALLATPLSAQFTVGPEKAVSTPVVGSSDRVAGFGGPDVVDVATNNDVLLLVWSENRSDLSTDIFAARLDDHGALLDPSGIFVATTPANEAAPRVIWTGSRFIAAWTAYDGPTVITRAAEIDVNGRVLQPNGVNVTEGRLTSLVWTGSTVMLSVQRPSAANSNPRAGIGALSTSLVYTNLADISEAYAPHLAAYSSGVIAVWLHPGFGTNQFAAEWQRFGLNGDRIGGVQPLGDLGTFSGMVSLVAGASGTGVVVAAAGDDMLRVARISDDSTRAGTGLTPPSGQIVVTDVGGPGLEVLATVNGVLTLYRFDSGDSFVSSTRPSPLALWGRIVTHDDLPFLAWAITPSPGVANVYGGFLPISNATTVSRSAESQQEPALATDNNSVLAVWTENRGTQYDAVLGRRLDKTGTPLGSTFVIADDQTPSDSPVVAFNGTDYIVFWQELRFPSQELWTTLLSRRVGPNGTPADVVQISPNAYISSEPAVATDGRNILIAWTEGDIRHPELRSALFAPNRFISPVSIVLPAVFSPTVDWNGDSYVVVAEASGPALKAILVNREGALVTSGEATIPPAGLTDTEPSIAWNGSVHLLVYQRGDTLAGTFLNRDGSRASADFQLAASGRAPRVAWDGTSFVVTWERGAAYRDLIAARVTTAGTLIGLPTVIAADPNANESAASMLPLGGGKTLLAYQRLAFEATGVHRAFTRVLGAAGKQRVVRH